MTPRPLPSPASFSASTEAKVVCPGASSDIRALSDTTNDVLVTGSSGFLGQAVVGQLGSRAIPCDIRAGISIEEIVRTPVFKRVRTVVHTAAVQLFTPGVNLRDEAVFQATNVDVLKGLLDACRRSRKVRKFIHISTDMVYGVPPETPLTEDAPLRPVGYYGRSKARAEALLEEYRDVFEIVTIFRPRIIVGPGRGGLVALLVSLARNGWPIPLFGDGRERLQMIHVIDFATLIEEAVNRDVGGTFNVGNVPVTTLREKVTALCTALGQRPWFVPVPRVLAERVAAALYRLGIGPLHPEQYLVAGRSFELDMTRTFTAFHWRPRFGDTDALLDVISSDPQTRAKE